MRPWTTKTMILAISGLTLLAIGTTFCFLWPVIFQAILETELPLSPTSRSFEIWRDTSDIPMHMEFYFFNWTNPTELKMPGKKPILVQVGPYTFIEKRQKVNITFHPDNDTVTYMQKKTWHFDQERSNGRLSDNITHLNVVAVSAAHKVRYMDEIYQTSLSFLLNQNSKLHVIKTVDELLFTGYKDMLIDMGKIAPIDGELPPFDRFGWFYMRNDTATFDGVVNMATGQNDINDLGVIKKWNYQDTTKYYKSPCNAVEGGAGEFFPPNRSKDDITMFTPDMCRSLTYEYVQTVSHKGITGYQYAIGERTLNTSTWRRYPHEQAKYFERTTTTEDFLNIDPSKIKHNDQQDDPDNINMGQCFCNGECSPMGLINVTACRYGAPGFISLPHFYKADPILLNQVVGLNPNDEEHNFYITIEPNTGIPIDVAARFQVNILLQPSLSTELLKDVPRIYFPIMWFNLRSGTTDDLAVSLKQLLSLPKIGFHSSLGMAVIGAIMLVVVAVIIYSKEKRITKNGKSRKIAATKEKKTESVYLDVTNRDDDNHTRTDRQLYQKS